jgi:hypothetical protein
MNSTRARSSLCCGLSAPQAPNLSSASAPPSASVRRQCGERSLGRCHFVFITNRATRHGADMAEVTILRSPLAALPRPKLFCARSSGGPPIAMTNFRSAASGTLRTGTSTGPRLQSQDSKYLGAHSAHSHKYSTRRSLLRNPRNGYPNISRNNFPSCR